jgi:protein SCO1
MKTAILLLISIIQIFNCSENELDQYKKNSELTNISIPINGSLPYFYGKDLQPIWNLENVETEKIRKIVSFSMVNQLNETVTEKNLDGNVSIISFFFTKCSGICPMITNNLKVLQNQLSGEKNLHIYSFSATPEMDNPTILLEFAKKRGINTKFWNLLTGNKQEIYSLARISINADTITARENAKKKITEKDFLHSENLYLIDKNKNLRGIYSGRLIASIEELIQDYQILKNEKIKK